LIKLIQWKIGDPDKLVSEKGFGSDESGISEPVYN